MSIVLNENEWAENKLAERDLGKKPFETLTRIARYYIDNGYKKEDTRTMLESFILQCDSSASIPKWTKSINMALNKALKNKAIDIPYVVITDNEINRINSLDGIQIRRLAFTLLCLAKYWDLAGGHSDHWVNTKDSEIMSMANINTSIKRQSLMYHSLMELGMIQFSKKVDNTNVRVNFYEDGKDAMHIDDFRNLGNQYMMLSSKQYIKCSGCGLIVKKTNKVDTMYKADYSRQKFCPKCAANIRIRRNVGRVMEIDFECASS